MCNYMKAQFQMFLHKLIKFTNTWGTAFSLRYLIKIWQTNWKAVMGAGNYSHRPSLPGIIHVWMSNFYSVLGSIWLQAAAVPSFLAANWVRVLQCANFTGNKFNEF